MRVGIVGAGITGLALHHHLDERGVESVVFEASDEPGGVIRTIRRGGSILDLGPQRTRLSPSVRELIEAAGVENRVVRARESPLYVHHGGKNRLVPKTVREAVATDLLSVRGKLRALLEPFAGPPREGETVYGFLTRAFGREVADHFVGPLYGGLYGSHPDDMPVEHSLARALENVGVSGSILVHVLRALYRGAPTPPIVSFEDGLQELPRALYDRHRETVSLSTPVVGIQRTSRGVRVETGSDEIDVDAVVLTTPAGIAASLLEGVDPRSAAHLRRLTYNPLAVVHLRSDADLDGAGVQIPFDEPYEMLGCTWTAGLFDRDGGYVCYFGGAKAPEAIERPTAELEELATREFESITGYAAEPIHVHRLRPGMPAYDTSWRALSEISPPTGVYLCANYTDRAGIPGRVRAAARLADRLAGPG